MRLPWSSFPTVRRRAQRRRVARGPVAQPEWCEAARLVEATQGSGETGFSQRLHCFLKVGDQGLLSQRTFVFRDDDALRAEEKRLRNSIYPVGNCGLASIINHRWIGAAVLAKKLQDLVFSVVV